MMTQKKSAVEIAILAALVINAVFMFANGLFMLWDPLGWYNLVPGVVNTGGYNQHFIRDIGLIKIGIGAAFVLGIYQKQHRVVLWSAGALWLAGHALFHFWEVAVGICGPEVLPRDFPAVTLPAIIGIVAALWAMREPRRN